MTADRSLFLHVGVHKTGTTALQKFLDDNRALLTQRGLYWPEVERPPGITHTWGHHNLAWTLRDGDSAGLWNAASQTFPHSASIIISSEEFCLFRQPAKFRPIKAALKGFRIRPVCFLRRQDQLLESIYKHHVKDLGETQPIMDFAKRVWTRLDHAGFVATLCQAFGRRNVILRLYDQSELRAGIYSEFLDTVGLKDQAGFATPEKDLNLSLSAEGLQAMLEANARYRNDTHKLRKVRQLILRQYSAKIWSEHEVLADHERTELMEMFLAGNSHIAREFFGRETLF